MYKEYKYQLGSHENCSTSIFSFFKNGYNQKVLGVNTTPSMPLTIILPIQISINEGGTRSASLLGFIRPSFNYKKSWQPLTFPVSVVIRIANTSEHKSAEVLPYYSVNSNYFQQDSDEISSNQSCSMTRLQYPFVLGIPF